MAVFDAYVDESGNAEDTYFVVGGFVAHHDVWEALERQWIDALPKTIAYFHTTDCFTRNNEFKDIDIPERVALLNKLTDIVAAHDVRLIVCRLPVKAYKQVAPKRKNEFWVSRYVGLFPDVVRLACEYSVGHVPPPTLPSKTEHICHIWWEENEYTPSAGEFMRIARNNPAFWWRIALGKGTQGTKRSSRSD